jgi:6-pyruvoyltetrahydropterin/6-carboxytetrahydropterin synthase
MASSFRVHIQKDQLIFCSGHFITYEGNTCERLHGHNYRVSVEVTGPLDTNHYVFDFIALKRLTKEITDELDHRMMLPTKSRLIQVQTNQDQVDVRFENRRWSFPLGDCVLLPIENTTAELLAKYLAGRIKENVKRHSGFTPEAITVELEESMGQSAIYSETP